MKRRQLIRYAGAGCLGAVVTTISSRWSPILAQTPAKEQLTIQYLGHTCFLFSGSGVKFLVNPYRNLGCTQGYRFPKPEVDLVLISSQLLDEGAIDQVPGRPKVVFEPGFYDWQNIEVQGIGMPHDREGGRRFGMNTAWRWTQGGIKIVHLGGAAAPIELEQKTLLGKPDVLLVPVGGGSKAYNPQEAKEAIATLNPKLVIPTHYRTEAASENLCNLVTIDDFLTTVPSIPAKKIDQGTLTLTAADLSPEMTEIKVLSHSHLISN